MAVFTRKTLSNSTLQSEGVASDAGDVEQMYETGSAFWVHSQFIVSEVIWTWKDCFFGICKIIFAVHHNPVIMILKLFSVLMFFATICLYFAESKFEEFNNNVLLFRPDMIRRGTICPPPIIIGKRKEWYHLKDLTL